MTGQDFFANAILKVAGNSTFAADWDKEQCSTDQWAQRVCLAAEALTDMAIRDFGLILTDEDKPEQPP